MRQGPATDEAGVSSRLVEPFDATPLPAPRGKSGILFGLCVLLLLPAGMAAQVADPLGGLLWTEIFVFLVPAVVATSGSGLEPRTWLRLRPPSATAAALGLLAGGAGWLLGSSLFAAVRAVSPRELVERYDLSRLFEGPPVEQAAFVAAAVIVAPLCEEIAFRGHLASAFHSRHRPAYAIGASALIFALIHLDPLRGPALVLLGAVYGWLAWRSGSIWPAVIAHATNNGIATALALATGGGAEAAAEPTLKWALVGVALGVALLALVVALHRAVLPASLAPGALHLADASDLSNRFRLQLVGRDLRWLIAVGLATFVALLLKLT
jgi:membrane protease YdiL (CAAX protease family)